MPVLFPSRAPAPDTEDEGIESGPKHIERARTIMNLHFWESLGSQITLQAFSALFDVRDYKRAHLTRKQTTRVRNYLRAYGCAMLAVEEVCSLQNCSENTLGIPPDSLSNI